MAPASSTAETRAQAVKRRREASRMVDPRVRRKRRQRLTITILVTLLLVMSGVAYGAWTYVQGFQSKISRVVTPQLAASLAEDAPKAPGEPFYMLLMGDDRRPGETHARSDTLILARIDPQKKKVQMISIPRDSRVKIPGYGAPQKINAAAAWGGPELTIKTIKELTGVKVSHFLTVDFTGLKRVVDAMGGVWIDVPQEIDARWNKKSAWETKYRLLHKGYQKLNGTQALAFVRARHQFADGDFSRMRNQQTFIKALAKQGLSLSSVFNATNIISALSDNITTDLSVAQMVDLVRQFKGMKDADIETTTVPSHSDYIDGTSYVIIEEAKLDAMIARLERGESLEVKAASGSQGATATPSTTPSTLKPSDVTLTIRNGAGVSGLAKNASDLFSTAGYVIKESGNMNQFVYGKTLVVYKTATKAEAGMVHNYLGYGDIVPAAGLYKFNTDILVVVGKDWKLSSPKR